MPTESALPQIQTEPGQANAEDGFVILDGPDGIAVTMTADAAAGTGHSLLAAAEIANVQSAAVGNKALSENDIDPD
jgi:hypothetical protein